MKRGFESSTLDLKARSLSEERLDALCYVRWCDGVSLIKLHPREWVASARALGQYVSLPEGTLFPLYSPWIDVYLKVTNRPNLVHVIEGWLSTVWCWETFDEPTINRGTRRWWMMVMISLQACVTNSPLRAPDSIVNRQDSPSPDTSSSCLIFLSKYKRHHFTVASLLILGSSPSPELSTRNWLLL